MKLIIGNKLHSSWSLRPWLLLSAFGIPFEEVLIPFGPNFDDPEWKAKVMVHNPAGKVPALVDGQGDQSLQAWESLSIMEYIADKHLELAIWPRERAARAFARNISSEMHAGFSALRNACPMNLGKRHAPKDRGPKVAADVTRITAIWNEARSRWGAKDPANGPFLFGAFSAADAMFAPVCTRFRSYSISVDPVSEAYCDAIYAHPAFVSWRKAALAEPWIVPEDEIDEPVLENYRPHLKTT
ncbi:MAG: glutathione S-transferase family protein [Bosea sp. (in: a-proteobacteria)]